jgi:hypothetical protein
MARIKISTELQLSPHVIKHWKQKGYCVHGEVAVYGKSIFIDHVAHLGPCHEPTYVVAIEMKSGASKSLRSQMWTIDRRHLADELWGVSIASPRDSTLKKWDDAKRQAYWINAGLLSWEGDCFKQHRRSRVTLRKHHSRYYCKNRSGLLLVPENKDSLAGYPSNGDHDYITHWSYGVSKILEWAQEQVNTFTTKECYANLPRAMNAYRKRRSAMNRMLRYLVDEGELEKVGKKGRYNAYRAT